MSPPRLLREVSPRPDIKRENFSSAEGPEKEEMAAAYLPRTKQLRQNLTSHRIIEKRRRDRMNNCLSDLSKLIPPDYLRKGRGRIEKTEIIEMATKYIEHFQNRDGCMDREERGPNGAFTLGYQECVSEVIRYLATRREVPSSEMASIQLVNHLQQHYGNFEKMPQPNPGSNSSLSGSSEHCTRIVSHTQHSSATIKDSCCKEGHQKHSNNYASCDDENPYSFMKCVQYSSLALDSMGDYPEETVDDAQGEFPQQRISSTNDQDEKNLGDNFQNNTLYPKNTDMYETPQDIKVAIDFSPVFRLYRDPCSGQQTHVNSPLRAIRKPETSQPSDSGVSISDLVHADNVVSYKFKNSIKQRFSQFQSTDYTSSSPSDGVEHTESVLSFVSSPDRRDCFHNFGKIVHKRRKYAHNRHVMNNIYQTSSSGTNTSDIIPMKVMANDEDIMQELVHEVGASAQRMKNVSCKCSNERLSCGSSASIGVPIFALHAKGSFYVPMNVNYDCLIPFLGPHDLLDTAYPQANLPLHPVTINVNFQTTA